MFLLSGFYFKKRKKLYLSSYNTLFSNRYKSYFLFFLLLFLVHNSTENDLVARIRTNLLGVDERKNSTINGMTQKKNLFLSVVVFFPVERVVKKVGQTVPRKTGRKATTAPVTTQTHVVISSPNLVGVVINDLMGINHRGIISIVGQVQVLMVVIVIKHHGILRQCLIYPIWHPMMQFMRVYN